MLSEEECDNEGTGIAHNFELLDKDQGHNEYLATGIDDNEVYDTEVVNQEHPGDVLSEEDIDNEGTDIADNFEILDEDPGHNEYLVPGIDDNEVYNTEVVNQEDLGDIDYVGTDIDDNLELLCEDDPGGNIPISYHNALVFNETYQNDLHGMLNTLQEALQQNRFRQEELETELVELEQGRSLDQHLRNVGSNSTANEHVKLLPSNPLASSTRKNTVCIFAAPYFKVNF